MCGRFTLDVDFEDLLARYGLEQVPSFFFARGEITPGMTIFAVTKEGPRPLKWGLKASFSKRPLINARMETVLTKPFFKDHFFHRRCLIPASMFYEWDHEKRKIGFYHREESIISLAGLFTDQSEVAIFTRPAGKNVESVHDREPVFIERNLESRYLESQQFEAMIQFLSTSKDQWIKM